MAELLGAELLDRRGDGESAAIYCCHYSIIIIIIIIIIIVRCSTGEGIPRAPLLLINMIYHHYSHRCHHRYHARVDGEGLCEGIPRAPLLLTNIFVIVIIIVILIVIIIVIIIVITRGWTARVCARVDGEAA